MQLSRQFINIISQEKLIVQCKLEKQLQHSNSYIFPRSSNSPNFRIYNSFIPEFCSHQMGHSPHNLLTFSLKIIEKLWCFFIKHSCSQPYQLTKYHFKKYVWTSYPKPRTTTCGEDDTLTTKYKQKISLIMIKVAWILSLSSNFWYSP